MDRIIEQILLSRLAKFRSVALLGSRQVGKSYLLKEILKRHPGNMISFDDPLERKEATKDPLLYLEQRYEPGKFLFIDEAAKVPEIFNAVKILVDRYDPKPTGICLANSGNFMLLRRIKESLAGRVSLLPIYPLSWQELTVAKKKPGLLRIIEGDFPENLPNPGSMLKIQRTREEGILWGGYPTPVTASDRDSRIIWSRDYIQTYIMPLVIEQFNIRDTFSFEQAARILFTQNTQFHNVNKIAQLVGVSQPTAAGYVHQLRAMMVLDLVPVFWRSAKKRLIKQPKLYASDPILLHQLLGTGFSLEVAKDQGRIGGLYETYIYNEIQKMLVNYDSHAEIFTWRTQDKAEVDIILSSERGLVPIEVKWSEKLTRRDASGLHSFLECYPEVDTGYIIYPGEAMKRISDKVLAIPDWWFFGCWF